MATHGCVASIIWSYSAPYQWRVTCLCQKRLQLMGEAASASAPVGWERSRGTANRRQACLFRSCRRHRSHAYSCASDCNSKGAAQAADGRCPRRGPIWGTVSMWCGNPLITPAEHSWCCSQASQHPPAPPPAPPNAAAPPPWPPRLAERAQPSSVHSSNDAVANDSALGDSGAAGAGRRRRCPGAGRGLPPAALPQRLCLHPLPGRLLCGQTGVLLPDARLSGRASWPGGRAYSGAARRRAVPHRRRRLGGAAGGCHPAAFRRCGAAAALPH